MTGAELAVRVTSARAVLANYRRAAPTADARDRALWAGQLADVLGFLLAEIQRPVARIDGSQATSWVARDGSAVLCHQDLLTVLGSLAEASDFTSTENRVRYAALSYRLGRD